jgi:hypothetical protein
VVDIRQIHVKTPITLTRLFAPCASELIGKLHIHLERESRKIQRREEEGRAGFQPLSSGTEVQRTGQFQRQAFLLGAVVLAAGCSAVPTQTRSYPDGASLPASKSTAPAVQRDGQGGSFVNAMEKQGKAHCCCCPCRSPLDASSGLLHRLGLQATFIPSHLGHPVAPNLFEPGVSAD